MADIIFSAPDYNTLLTDAEALGFVTEDAEGNKSIVTRSEEHTSELQSH